MNILGLVGSPRKKGNTAVLVQKALEAARRNGAKTEIVFLSDYRIADCAGCEGCRRNYRCVVADDMQKIYPLLWQADGLILGSPTYFYNISAPVKALLDRCYCFEAFDDNDRSVWMGVHEALGLKYAAVIAVCEQNTEEDMGFTEAAMTLPLEALGYRVIDKVKVLRVFEAGRVVDEKEFVQAAAKAGEKLVKVFRLREKLKNILSEVKPAACFPARPGE